MAVFSRVVDFLPKNTKLMVIIEPSGDFDQVLKKYLISPLNEKQTGSYIALHLDEPLTLEISISKNGRICKNLKPCKCSTPILDNEKLKSINHAYQKISELLEKDRASFGGKVYNKVLFQGEDEYWQILEFRREKVYQLYKEEFEEHLRTIEEKLDNYIKPLFDKIDQLDFQTQITTKISNINILQSENKNLQTELQQLNDLLERSKLTAYRKKLEEFEERLGKDYPEASGQDSWQEWIYKNTWIFGIQYGTAIGHPQVGFRSILDYLFTTPDGFVDILEIKKPSHEVIKEDKSHPGAFRWSSEVNEAIGQVIKYLSEIELHQLEIAKKLKQVLSLDLSTIKPRAFILIGKSDDWNDIKKEAFRKLNHSLHGIEVLTYTDLFRRGKNLIKVYAD